MSCHSDVTLSSTLMKLLTCQVGIIFLIHILIWKLGECDLLQFMLLSKLHLIHSDCTWFTVLLALLYTISFPIWFCSFLVGFVSFYIIILFELHQPVQSQHWVHLSCHFTDGCLYCWDFKLLLPTYPHLYSSSAFLTSSMLVGRLLRILLCITRCFYTQHLTR